MVIIEFLMQDKPDKIRFLEEIFLPTNNNMDVVLKMLFLAFSNTNIQFNTESFTQRTYNIVEALLIAKQMELINKYKFAKVAWDKNSKMILVHVAALKSPELTIHDFQVSLLTILQQDKASAKIPLEQIDYNNVFFLIQ